MTQVKIKTTNVFNRAYAADTRIVCLQGGTRSSKTYSLIQLFITKALQDTGKVFSVIRKTLPALKGTSYRDFLNILKELGLYSEEYHNKSELSYILNNNLIEFLSVDNPAKLRGRKRHYAWLNEPTEFSVIFCIVVRILFNLSFLTDTKLSPSSCRCPEATNTSPVLYPFCQLSKDPLSRVK